jgi:hypothetical protein
MSGPYVQRLSRVRPSDAHHGFAVFLCAQGRWFGLIASDPTVSRWFSTLAADAPAALADARAATRAWAAAGEHAPDHGITAEHPLTIDLDATLLDAPGDKEHASPTFERGHGFHPLCMFIDHVLDRKRWDTKEELPCSRHSRWIFLWLAVQHSPRASW